MVALRHQPGVADLIDKLPESRESASAPQLYR